MDSPALAYSVISIVDDTSGTEDSILFIADTLYNL
jgi:hypothetical protein